jgi:integrase
LRATLSGIHGAIPKDSAGLTKPRLRGTFITLAYRNGVSIKEIAEASGHAEKEAERIIRQHYLAGDAVIEKLETGTGIVKRSENCKTGFPE